ncbi:hypothetical protein NPIL_334921 [Nephila pilipes]|uniref:Uncharacterized protein n=1 Tax=Nephila pilipes TaxID=299642 RepID=A0A8X6NIK6_NEPPI|nr:hypothetical protein NPIL_334921 [Nephila pilipes]
MRFLVVPLEIDFYIEFLWQQRAYSLSIATAPGFDSESISMSSLLEERRNANNPGMWKRFCHLNKSLFRMGLGGNSFLLLYPQAPGV